MSSGIFGRHGDPRVPVSNDHPSSAVSTELMEGGVDAPTQEASAPNRSGVVGEEKVAKNTAVVAMLTLLSRITGFARVVAIAAVLGVNRFSDLYQSLNLLPNYTHELLTGSLITALLVPPLVRHLDQGDVAGMRRIAGGFLTLVIGLAIVVVAVIVAAGALVVRLFTVGVSDAAQASELLRLGWPLLALLMPQVVFYAIAATGAAAQNATGRFALAAGAPVVENLMIIAVLGIWAGRFGTGIESVAGVGTDQVVFLGLGTTAAVAVHAALQWFGAARCGVALFPRPGWRDPEVRNIVRLALPSAGYAALNTARLVSFLVAAGLITGGQTLFLVALNFFNLPVALTSKPLATATMPTLARLRESAGAFADRYRRGFGVLLLFALPAAAVMMGLARPIATMGLWGDATSAESITLLAAAVAAVALAVPGESVFIFSTSAAYAKLDARSPFRAMAIRLGVSVIAVGLVAVAFQADVIDGWRVLLGLGLAMALADTVGAAYLARRVTEGTGGLLSAALPPLGIGLAVVAVAGWSAGLAEDVFGLSRLVATLALVGGGLASMAAITGLTAARGGNELREFIRPGRTIIDLDRLDLSTADVSGADVRGADVSSTDLSTADVSGADASSADLSTADLSTAQPSRHSVARPATPSPERRRAERPLGDAGDLPPTGIARRLDSRLTTLAGFAALAGLGLLAAVAIVLAGPAAPVVPAVLAGLVLVGLVAWKPEIGPLILLASTPLIVGLTRGSVLPVLRINEAILFAVAGGVGLRISIDLVQGRRFRLATPPDRLDWAIGAVVLAGSALPLMVRFGRGLDISLDDITQAFIFAKFGLLYFVVRAVIRTQSHVRRALTVSIAASIPVALLALAQSMQVPGVAEFLGPWLDQPPEVYIGRGAGTIGNSIALGDVMAVHLAIAMMALLRHRDAVVHETRATQRRALILGVATAIFVIGALGSGQFSGFAAAGVAVVAAALAARRPRLLLALPAATMIAGIGLWPVISRRLDGFNTSSGLPQSWQARIDNLNEFFLPVLGRDFNWALGVRPDTSVDNPDEILGETFIESGFVWLVWVGGLVLLAAFVFLMFTAGQRFLTAARARDPWLGAVGAGGLAATGFIGLLTITDPHLTLRGIADVYFPLMAMALVAAAAPSTRTKPTPSMSAPAVTATAAPEQSLGYARYSLAGRFFKRTLDIVVSAFLLVFLGPLLLLLMVAVRLTSAGPAFFRQTRIGFAEQPFTIYKFRTMRVDGDDGEHRRFVQGMLRDEDESGEYKMTEDPRITRLGRFLRRTSLDELPQLVNVLAGEMSLVGPRPCIEYEARLYRAEHRLRAASVPGMTGLWQVEGRSEIHMLDALELDIEYVRTCSITSDLGILLRTVKVVLRGSGV